MEEFDKIMKKIFLFLILIVSVCAMTTAFSACALDDDDPETAKIYFTVTFDGNGGVLVNGSEEQIVKYASDIEYPTYEKAGYVFVGWEPQITVIKNDMTVKAVWEKQPDPTYTVVFLGGGGTLKSGSDCQVVKNASEIVAPEYERAHYVFTGWDKSLDVINEDMTVTAQWEITEYTVSFNLNSLAFPGEQSLVDGNAQVDSVKIKYGESFGDKLPEFTPIDDEYEKFGWIYVNSNGIKNLVYSTTVINDELFNGVENLQIELFAEITEKGAVATFFSVTFDGNGGTLVMGSVTQLVESATELVEPIFEREGYTFTGWDILLSEIKGDTVVTATWKVKKYTVKFSLKCFTENTWAYSKVNGYDTVFDLFVEYGHTLGDKLYKFVPDDSETYKVVGWKYTPDQGKEFIVTGDTVFDTRTFGEVEDMVITLKAQLASNTFEVIFDGNGGTLVKGEDRQVIPCGGNAVAPEYERENYMFIGWDKPTTDITEDVVIKAVWRPLKYLVKFNLTCYGLDGEEAKSTINGRTSVPDVYVEYGKTLDLTSYKFDPVKYEDYSRKGWAYILKDGTKKYVDNDTVFTEEFFNECEDNEIVLVAQLKSKWTPIIPIS